MPSAVLKHALERVDDLAELWDFPHTVFVGRPDRGPIIASYRECIEWLNDPFNGSRGRYGVIIDDFGLGMSFYFSDVSTAFWFKMRWSGAH